MVDDKTLMMSWFGRFCSWFELCAGGMISDVCKSPASMSCCGSQRVV